MGPDPIRLVFLQKEKMWAQKHRGACVRAHTHTHTHTQKRSGEDSVREQPSASQGERLLEKPNC